MPPLFNPTIMIWGKRTNESELQFSTRAEAFAYMLKWQLEEKKAEPMEAAEKANQFADIFAKNMGIPGKVEPQPEGIDRYLQMADKVMIYCDQHPKAVDMVIGAVTFIAGAVTGKKVAQNEQPQIQQHDPIDFDNVN